jgi:hypothetical protein
MAVTLAWMADAANTWKVATKTSVVAAFGKLSQLVELAAKHRQQAIRDAHSLITSGMDAAEEERKAILHEQSHNMLEDSMQRSLQVHMLAVKEAAAVVDTVTKLPNLESLPPPSASIQDFLEAASGVVAAGGFGVTANQ